MLGGGGGGGRGACYPSKKMIKIVQSGAISRNLGVRKYVITNLKINNFNGKINNFLSY